MTIRRNGPTRLSRRRAARRATGTKSGPTTPAIRYLESSAVLAALLEQDASALRALRADGLRVTSALTFAEASRAVIRAGVARRLTPVEASAAQKALSTLQRRCTVIAVSEAVLARTGRPFPVEPIRTLDAVHLATAELVGATYRPLIMVTRDARIRDNATALGYEIA